LRILVTFALENEFAPWRKIRDFRKRNGERISSIIANIEGAEAIVALTGAGPAHARRVMEEVLEPDARNFELCVSAGLCGALSPEYEVGQIVVAKSAFLATERREIRSDEELLRFACDLGARPARRFCTVDRVLVTKNEKSQFAEIGEIVEMESFVVMELAAAAGIPTVAIRAVSDVADEDLPLDMNQIFSSRGTVSMRRVAGEIARHPASITGLARLGTQSRNAAERLARFLDGYLSALVRNATAHQRIECLS
jgi:adenosylhomocysteine nucleosidase